MFSRREIVAIIVIAALMATIYIFSFTPYLLNPRTQGSSPSMEIAIPGVAVVLIVVLLLLVPKRKAEVQEETVQLQGEDQEKIDEQQQEQPTHNMPEHRFRLKSIRSGAIGGFLAGLVLVGLLFAANAVLGFPYGTLYSIVGNAVAHLTMPYSLYFGIGMHLLTATLIGMVFGYVTSVVGVFDIASIRKGAVMGVLAGFASFSLVFIPITRFGVQNSLVSFLATNIYPAGTDQAIIQSRALDIMSTVLAGAILFHVIYGALMGSITAALLLRRTHAMEEQEEKKRKVIGTH